MTLQKRPKAQQGHREPRGALLVKFLPEPKLDTSVCFDMEPVFFKYVVLGKKESTCRDGGFKRTPSELNKAGGAGTNKPSSRKTCHVITPEK